METLKYINKFGLDALTEEFGICVGEYDNFYVLNYSQIESPKLNPIVKECRGLIIDKDLKTVLCRSFDRFFNWGETEERMSINNNVVCMAKEDGSLINVWFNPHSNKWTCSTRKMAFGEGQNSFGMVFNELVDTALDEELHSFCERNKFCQGYTYIFELTSPKNRIVTQYKETKLKLLGVRFNNVHLLSSNSEYCKNGGYLYVNELKEICYRSSGVIELPKMFLITCYEDVKKELNNLSELNEGFVLWNQVTGKRIKAKSPSYVAVHHLRGNGIPNPKNIMTLVVENEVDEYLTYFPEDEEMFLKYDVAFEDFKDKVLGTWESVNHLRRQKDFALEVKNLPFSSLLFNLRKGKCLDELIKNMPINRLLQMMELR